MNVVGAPGLRHTTTKKNPLTYLSDLVVYVNASVCLSFCAVTCFVRIVRLLTDRRNIKVIYIASGLPYIIWIVSHLEIRRRFESVLYFIY